jgi:hypothetical protein
MSHERMFDTQPICPGERGFGWDNGAISEDGPRSGVSAPLHPGASPITNAKELID